MAPGCCPPQVWQMRIKSTEKIAGRPALSVRDFFRHNDDGFVLTDVRAFFGVAATTASRMVKAFVESGYAEPSAPVGGLKCWKTTIKGRQLAHATAAKPISRATAERKLSEFLERVKIIRDDPYYLYRVTRVVVFGSYLSGSKDLGDIDLAVRIVHKEGDPDKQRALNKQRCREAEAGGRSFGAFVDRLYWPETEVRRFLKSGSRCFSLHDLEEIPRLGCEHKVIYEDE